MNPVCQFKPASITLEFKGTAPFTFYYSLKTPLVSENIEKIDGNSASYHFKSDESGLKEFEISRIDDELYKKISPNIFISLQVYENPIAEILNGPEISFKCNKSENIIQVKVSGSFPVKLTLEIIHNLKVNRVLINVNETLFNYSPVLETGKNTIVLIGVLDNNGCESNFEGKSKSKIIVNVLERPRIAGIERKDACSGDVLSYQLQGQAPFQVNYQIGGVDSFVTCHDSVVLFYASTPGDFVITGVCNGGGCCADVFLLTRIHALPKAIIHNGEDFSLDLREGQETKIKVELVGESPFGLSWTRRIDGVTETFNAQDIKEDEYMINTSREGLYQVVSVSDGFCKYPRVEVEGANAVNVVV